MSKPAHHRSDGRFKNPWPDAGLPGGALAILKWQWHRLRHGVPAAPDPSRFPRATPRLARPRAAIDECRVTWLGQSGFLLQAGTLNLLTDPVLSQRASPLRRFGPARVVATPLGITELPPIDAVLISHDHYDHLDRATCAQLIERFGSELGFFAPLGYRSWLEKLGARCLTELDWWHSAQLAGTELVALPSQHWTRRGLDTGRRLWCSWLVRSHPQSIYFCGDSGYCPAFADIRARAGAPDIALLPIGAYEPRWFMKAAHMNPEEAVQAYVDLGAREFVAMHWGTFQLTDEPMLEPPVRVRNAWQAQHLDAQRLHIPNHGETLTWRAGIRSTT